MRAVADRIWCVTAGAFPSNSYVCRTGDAGAAILIDPGLDPGPIAAALAAQDLVPTAIFCTHGHFDHIGSARHFQDRHGIPVHLHRGDAKTAGTNNFLLMAMRMDAKIALPDLTLVDDEATFTLDDDEPVRYRAAPGHTPGSCVIAWGTNLFTGDTLYARGVGLSKLPGEKPSLLRRSICRLWDELDAFTIHPGHGPSAAGTAVKRDNDPLLSFLAQAPEAGHA